MEPKHGSDLLQSEKVYAQKKKAPHKGAWAEDLILSSPLSFNKVKLMFNESKASKVINFLNSFMQRASVN
jgi:hypothetical protein